MFHPTLQLDKYLSSYYDAHSFHYNIVQIGTGGNGGYLVQRLSKLLYALSQKEGFSFSYKLVDGDQIEEKNLLRQPFVEEDINEPKAQTLVERYSNAYEIPILYRNQYVESAQEIVQLFNDERNTFSHSIPILLGCVDNNATRKLMHEVFQSYCRMIYIDSGIDSVDEEGSIHSGYSGQVVCGVRLNNKEYLSSIGGVYPDILSDTDSRLPTQACGEQVVYYPQRMQTNEMAALIMNGYLNTLLSDQEIVSHYTNFNARTMMVRPTYLTEEQVTK